MCFPASGIMCANTNVSWVFDVGCAGVFWGDGMKNRATLLVGAALMSAMCGCQATGESYAPNVYSTGQVNSRQEAKTVNILAVMPAKVEVDNHEQKQAAQVFGAILGAVAGGMAGHSLGDRSSTNTALGVAGGAAVGGAAGSIVKDKVLVDGVSITYTDDGKTFNSAQVGKMCEFAPGLAVVVSMSSTETRIQPNTTCPVAEAK